jgi:hypothetical protein
MSHEEGLRMPERRAVLRQHALSHPKDLLLRREPQRGLCDVRVSVPDW